MSTTIDHDSNAPLKTVLITGASSGIGYGLAEAYLAKGANVVLNARNGEKLQAAATRLGSPERIATVVGDVSHKAIADRIVHVAIGRFGRVDTLINNAGVFASKPLDAYDEADVEGFLGNVRGAYFATQAAAAALRDSGSGSIVNITTILAQRGVREIPASAPVIAKGGITSLTASLAIELAPDNIRVNAVSPGIVRTPLHGLDDAQLDEFNGMQPLGRIGEVRDIVDAVLYLDEAAWVTGVILPVDGGVLAGG